MNDKTLKKKMQEASEQFEKLNKEKEDLQQRISEIDTELVRLQGEYRAYEKLREPKESFGDTEKVDDANTITVEEAVEDGK